MNLLEELTEVVEVTPNRFLIGIHKSFFVNRINIPECLEKEGEVRKKFIGSSNEYLLEKLLFNSVDHMIKEEETRLIGFSSNKSYWPFDVKEMFLDIDSKNHIDSKLDIDIVKNKIKPKKQSDNTNLIIYKPTDYIRKRGNIDYALDEIRNVIKCSNRVFFLDRNILPSGLANRFKGKYWITKKDSCLKIAEILGNKKKERVMALGGQTTLAEFHEKVHA